MLYNFIESLYYTIKSQNYNSFIDKYSIECVLKSNYSKIYHSKSYKYLMLCYSFKLPLYYI